jgi:hypothetical protein
MSVFHFLPSISNSIFEEVCFHHLGVDALQCCCSHFIQNQFGVIVIALALVIL